MQFVLLTNISIHTCPNCDWSSMSSRIEYRGEAAPLLSRGAATVSSPGRKPGEDVVFEVKPRRGERSNGMCRTYGAHARKGRNPRACARGYILSPLRGFNRMRFARYFGQQWAEYGAYMIECVLAEQLLAIVFIDGNQSGGHRF